MSQYTILLVEDDEVDVMNIQRAFKKTNILNKLVVAGDGIEALEIIESGQIHKPTLILLDLNMPRMGGIEFLQRIRANPKWEHCPVVILTTSKEEKDKVEAYKLGIVGYVVKPIEMPGFLEAVGAIGTYWSICEFPQA